MGTLKSSTYVLFSKWSCFYTFIEYFLCVRWVCTHGFILSSQLPSRGSLRYEESDYRRWKGWLPAPALGSAVRPLQGLGPGQELWWARSQSLCGPAWSPQILPSCRRLFSLAADWLLPWAHGREWLPHGSWIFKFSIQVRLTIIF